MPGDTSGATGAIPIPVGVDQPRSDHPSAGVECVIRSIREVEVIRELMDDNDDDSSDGEH